MHHDLPQSRTATPLDTVRASDRATDGSHEELELLARLHALHASERLFRVALPSRASLAPAVVYLSPGTAAVPPLVAGPAGRGSDLVDVGSGDGEVLQMLPPSVRRRLDGLAPGMPAVSFRHEFATPAIGDPATERAQGPRRWAEVAGHAHRDDDGTLVIEGVVRDVTTLRHLREAEQQRAARTRRLAEASSDVTMTIVRGPTTAVQWCSGNATSVLGNSAHRLEGPIDAVLEHIHPDDRAAAVRALNSPTDARIETRWAGDADPDNWRWVELLVVPVQYRDEAAGALADVRIRLIDHQKQAQQLATSAAAREREADAALGHLEAVRRHVMRAVSHRVRTPLSVIQAATETGLAVGPRLDDERLAGLFQQIDRATAALTVLLEDLLHLPDAAALDPVQPSPVDLLQVVSDELGDTIGVTRQVTVERPSSGLTVLGAESQLRRIVRHLLNNVIDHTPPDTVLTVRAARVGDTAVVELADDGPGIPTEILERVTEAFVAGPSDDSNPGLGLGLAIADRLARSQGGRLEVSSPATGGTVARLSLRAWPPPA